MGKSESNELCSNRKAYHDYEIVDKVEAGLQLQGTEIKSLRNHGGSLAEAYVRIIRGEVFLIGAHIAHYTFGNIHNHEERRDRKCLLHTYEIEKFRQKVQQKGMTLVPLSLYLKKGRAKLLIGLAKGKKHVDKRASIKERDAKRQMDRARKMMD